MLEIEGGTPFSGPGGASGSRRSRDRSRATARVSPLRWAFCVGVGEALSPERGED